MGLKSFQIAEYVLPPLLRHDGPCLCVPSAWDTKVGSKEPLLPHLTPSLSSVLFNKSGNINTASLSSALANSLNPGWRWGVMRTRLRSTEQTTRGFAAGLGEAFQESLNLWDLVPSRNFRELEGTKLLPAAELLGVWRKQSSG